LPIISPYLLAIVAAGLSMSKIAQLESRCNASPPQTTIARREGSLLTIVSNGLKLQQTSTQS
jgi:hypothetical protein